MILTRIGFIPVDHDLLVVFGHSREYRGCPKLVMSRAYSPWSDTVSPQDPAGFRLALLLGSGEIPFDEEGGSVLEDDQCGVLRLAADERLMRVFQHVVQQVLQMTVGSTSPYLLRKREAGFGFSNLD